MFKVAMCIGPLLLGAGAADAAVSVLGIGYARGCYEAAEKARPPRDGLRLCDSAVLDEALAADLRAATLVNRGIIHMQLQQIDAAIADYDAAISLRPATAEAYINKGIALLRLGNRDREAVKLLSEGIEMGPVKPEIAYFNRAIGNEALGRTREAYEDYSRAAQLAPDWPDPAVELQRFQTVRRKTAGV